MELESLVVELGRANTTVVQKAVLTVASLRTVDECLDEGMLRRQPTPPTQGRESIRGVYVMVSRAQSLEVAGDSEAALAVAMQAREQAEVLDWLPILATSRALEGKQLERTGAYPDAEAASSQAYFEAARSGAWNVAARAAIDLIYTVGQRLARHGDGREWAQHAAVALVHAGDPVGLWEAMRLNNLAAVQQATSAYAEAQALYERTLARSSHHG